MPNKYRPKQNYHNLRVVTFNENILPKKHTAVQDKKYAKKQQHDGVQKTTFQTKQNSIEIDPRHMSEDHYKEKHKANPREHKQRQDSKVLSNIRILYRKSRGRFTSKSSGDGQSIKDIAKTYNKMYNNSLKSLYSRSEDLRTVRPPTFPYRREKLKVIFFHQSSPRITGRSLFTSRRKKAPSQPVKGSKHSIKDLEPVKQIYSTEEMKLKLDEKSKEENAKIEKDVKIEVIKSKTKSFRSDGTHSTGFRSSTQVVLRCEPSTVLKTVQFPQTKGPAAIRLPARSRTTVAKCTPTARGTRKGVVLRRPQGTIVKNPNVQDSEKCDCFPKNLYKMSLKRCLKLWLLCLWSPCLFVAVVCWFVSYPFRYIEGCTCRREECQCKSTVRRAWAKSAFNTRSRFLRKNAGPVCSKKCKAMRRRNTYLTETGKNRFPCRCDPTFGRNFRSTRFRDRVSRVEREDHLHLVQKERELIASLAKEHASRANYARQLEAQQPRPRSSAQCDPCLVKLRASVMAAQIKTNDRGTSKKGKQRRKSPNTVSASQVAVKTSKKKIKPEKVKKPKKDKPSKIEKPSKKRGNTDDSDDSKKSTDISSSSDTSKAAKKDKFSMKFRNKLNNLKSKVKGKLSKTEVQSYASRLSNRVSRSISSLKIKRNKSDTSSEDGAKRKIQKKKKNKKNDDADNKKSRGKRSTKPLQEVYVQTCIANQKKPGRISFKKKRQRNKIFDHHSSNEGEIQAYKDDSPHKRKKSIKRKKKKGSRKSEVPVTKQTVAPICVQENYVIGSPEALERKGRLARVGVEREKQRICVDEDLRLRQAIEFGERSKTRDPIMRRDRLDLMSPTYASTYRKRLVRRGYPLDHRTVFKHDITYPTSSNYHDPTCGSPIEQDMRRRQYYTRKYKMRRNNMIFKCLRCKAADFGTRRQNVIVQSRYTNSPCRNNTNEVCRDIGAFHVNYYGWRAFRITTNRLCHQISRFCLLVCGICIWCPIFLIEHMIFKLCICICS